MQNTELCVNDECVDNKTLSDGKWRIEIEIDNLQANKLIVSDLVDKIVELTGFDEDDITVGVEIDENGKVINIVIIVDDEETAKIVVEAINGIDKGGECEYGVLCKVEKVRIDGKQIEVLSTGAQNVIDTIYLILVMTFLLL